MRDLYNCNTYILSWTGPRGNDFKSYTNRKSARDYRVKLKNRLGKKWHDSIKLKQITTANGFVEIDKTI